MLEAQSSFLKTNFQNEIIPIAPEDSPGGSCWIISFSVVSGVFTLSTAMLWTLLVLNDQQMKETAT